MIRTVEVLFTFHLEEKELGGKEEAAKDQYDLSDKKDVRRGPSKSQ